MDYDGRRPPPVAAWHPETGNPPHPWGHQEPTVNRHYPHR